ncbi:MAG: SPOR domain-containing protein [Legionella sp.]
MNKKLGVIIIGFAGFSMSACMDMEQRAVMEYPSYPAYTYYNNNTPYYQGTYQMQQYGSDNYRQPQTVSVPETYHVGAYHSPVSFKDRDREWVNSQNPRNYTIEMADGDKASEVAQKLYKAPKNDRMGQVQYQRNGKTYYKGLYGSYDSPEAAKKALDAMPAELKQGAGVKTWAEVQ